MFSGHKVVCYCNITKFGVATPSRPKYFSNIVLEALLRCRIVVVAKLYNCRMPSSDKRNKKVSTILPIDKSIPYGI